jgi:hypothetical protein
MPSFLASAKSLMSVLLHSLLNITSMLGFKMYSQIGVIFTSQYNFHVHDTHLSLFSLFSVQPTFSLNSHGQR